MTDTQAESTSSSEPADEAAPSGAASWGASRGLRYLWTQLTSMRTALVLLFALAVAAVPGSLVPQRTISPIRVSDFIAQHPVLGPLYDKVGLFHVYTSPWFSAVYLLLFTSLVGCIVPRVGVYVKAVRRRPPLTPRYLVRLPVYVRANLHDASGRANGADHSDQAAVLENARAELKRQRYRVVSDGDSVSAERGYLREAGNLLFHVSLLILLLGVAIGSLYGFRGSAVVITGQGFSNNLTQYDDISAGAWFTDRSLLPFSIVVKDFAAKFETGQVQRGAARLFRADLEVTDSPGSAPYAKKLEVNKPLNINGTTVHLIGHGYAPRLTVRDGNGNIAFSGPTIFLPQDGNFTSAGVVKAPDARPNRLAFEAIFTPTSIDGKGPVSAFPDAAAPALYLNVWSGPPRAETGTPESIYSLDKTGLTQMKRSSGSFVGVRLTPGQRFKLPNGQGSVQFDGWNRWVKLQIGDAPGALVTLTAVALAVLGLCLSLYIRPRRIWVRVRRRDDGTAYLEVAGLDRADARAGLSDDVQALATQLLPSPSVPGTSTT